MRLNSVEQVGISLSDVQAIEKQSFKEKNYANAQQKFNASTCSVCNKDPKDRYISCIECHILIHYSCTFLRPYQLYYFVEKNRKYTCIKCAPTSLVVLLSDEVDVLMNDIKEHLVEIETINYLLTEENQYLNGRGYSKQKYFKSKKKTL